MKTWIHGVLALFLVVFPAIADAEDINNNIAPLSGVWKANRIYGPELRGDLLIEERNGDHVATLNGRTVRARVDDRNIEFEFPGNMGRFAGRFSDRRRKIAGHWVQPRSISRGSAYASPVTLLSAGAEQWRGTIVPLNDEMTMFLSVTENESGELNVSMRNPDRNLGLYLQGERLERDGDAVRYIGKFRGRGGDQIFAEGTYDSDGDVLSLYFPSAGGTFDFKRVNSDPAGNMQRRPAEEVYQYRKPPVLDDGWQTATVEDVGMSRELISAFITDVIGLPNNDINAFDVHGILVARHGKIVLEEYFSGFHSAKPHDTRSASKSLTTSLVGAAIQAGEPVSLSTAVYETMMAHVPADLDAMKQHMTVRDLLIMAPGWNCDDRDSTSPGNEDNMQSQSEQPDWVAYTLDLPMLRAPGEKSIYCSAAPNVIGGVLAKATGKPLTQLFQELIAGPLKIGRYHMNLDPAGAPYMGGGIYWPPRDFMKLGQLMIDDGMWNGQRILPRGWAGEAGAPQVKIGDRDYGYLWWINSYKYKDRTVQAFFAGGNGGQIVMGIPELDLVIAFFGGNYSHSMTFYAQNTLIPERIIPAIDAD